MPRSGPLDKRDGPAASPQETGGTAKGYRRLAALVALPHCGKSRFEVSPETVGIEERVRDKVAGEPPPEFRQHPG
jgi:hypothetical protein